MANIPNPFEDLSAKLDLILRRIDELEKKQPQPVKPRVTLKDFCKEFEINRGTAYEWRSRGLIEFEKIGNRVYVPTESIKVTRKFQREPIEQ